MAIIKLKDLVLGDCWRYISGTDKRPAVTTMMEDPNPANLPDGWDDYGLDPECEYYKNNSGRKVELLEHYSVSETPRPLCLTRGDLKPGDCFQYLDHDDDDSDISPPHIVDGPFVCTSGMPRDWLVSTTTSARRRADSPVRRIPHWEKPFVANPSGPVVLPCIDPFKDLRDAIFVREEKRVDGMNGRECLWRFENGQRTESIATTRYPTAPGEERLMVCTHGEYGLTAAQIDLARDLWSYKLRLKVAEKAAADAERERTRVVCDYTDEL